MGTNACENLRPPLPSGRGRARADSFLRGHMSVQTAKRYPRVQAADSYNRSHCLVNRHHSFFIHPTRLNQLQREIERKGHHAVTVVCDLSDIVSVRRAAAEIVALNLSIAGLLNNAGITKLSDLTVFPETF